ncbi:MAG: hypothetical protein ACK4QP_00685 [Pseudorhizobium sp.]
MKYQVMTLAAVLAVSGCAKRPDAIVPADIPMQAYTSYGCNELSVELAKEKASLATVSKKQHDAATGDAFGVFLIGVPMSSTFGGDNEGNVAVAKGKVQAIESAMISKKCGAPIGKISS